MLKIFLFFIFILTTASFIHPVDDETYEMVLPLCKNEFNIPVAARSSKEKAAVLKFWRRRGKYNNVENVLYYDGKRVNLILLFRLDI